MKVIETCPVCNGELTQGSKAYYSRPFFHVAIEGVDFVASGFVTYARCETCGLLVQSPRMDDAAIASYYSTGLYRKWLNKTQESLDDDEYVRAAQDAALLVNLIGKPMSHLDVGSSRGYMLHLVDAEVQAGVEPNPDYNTPNVAAVVQDITDIHGQFELVTMIHSLEHVIDPIATLRLVDERASHWIAIEVPSEQSQGGWMRLAHTYCFPDETFQYIAESLSWKIKLIHHTPHTLVVFEKQEA